MSDYFEMADNLLPQKKWYCYAEAVVGKSWKACAREQCTNCFDYQKMLTPAHFPVPVVYAEHKHGQRWYNMISGQYYVRLGNRYYPTGEYPYGPNPMGFF